MWRELIGSRGVAVAFSRPAPSAEVVRVESSLSQALPPELRTLLLEANGLQDQYGTDVIWSAAQVLEENLVARSDEAFAQLYAPFDPFVFFGDNGGGDRFAFLAEAPQDGVWVWDHETDERTRVAGSLQEYLRRSLEADGEDWYRVE
ncbi:SMI1/KNR4 family protein [Streptomyces sp. NPDC059897]|uniref:SMI1/KNR4 family protein n=1 Tax=Streptomyces sp. NPDC059897 TaxID=3346994 RepID=UPI00364BEBB1